MTENKSLPEKAKAFVFRNIVVPGLVGDVLGIAAYQADAGKLSDAPRVALNLAVSAGQLIASGTSEQEAALIGAAAIGAAGTFLVVQAARGFARKVQNAAHPVMDARSLGIYPNPERVSFVQAPAPIGDQIIARDENSRTIGSVGFSFHEKSGKGGLANVQVTDGHNRDKLADQLISLAESHLLEKGAREVQVVVEERGGLLEQVLKDRGFKVDDSGFATKSLPEKRDN